MKIEFILGIPEEHREKAILLFEEAFGEKFSLAVNNKDIRLELFRNHFDLKFAIAAINDSQLVGIAGFSIDKNSLTSKLQYSHLIEKLGFLKGNWAALILSLYKRNSVDNQLLMDGISVDKKCRGQGIGEKLLNELISFAKARDFNRIRLDVIDSNQRAKKLYERVGFKVVRKERFPYLKWLLGFSGSEELIHIIRTDEVDTP